MDFQSSCPLLWPVGWIRTPRNSRDIARFRGTGFNSSSGSIQKFSRPHTMDESSSKILAELERLGAARVVISTNVPVNRSGLPYSSARAPEDPGSAVYFHFHTRKTVLACDKWTRVEDNLWAIACHIEALRSQERWGVGSIDQAFSGYTALPAPGEHSARTWYVILGVPYDSDFSTCKQAYLKKAKELHPDTANGSHSEMSELNSAWDECRRNFPGQ